MVFNGGWWWWLVAGDSSMMGEWLIISWQLRCIIACNEDHSPLLLAHIHLHHYHHYRYLSHTLIWGVWLPAVPQSQQLKFWPGPTGGGVKLRFRSRMVTSDTKPAGQNHPYLSHLSHPNPWILGWSSLLISGVVITINYPWLQPMYQW